MAGNNNGQNALLLRILSRFSESFKSNVTRIAVNDFVSITKETLSELKEVDTLLTQILLWRLKIDNACGFSDEYLVSYSYGDN